MTPGNKTLMSITPSMASRTGQRRSDGSRLQGGGKRGGCVGFDTTSAGRRLAEGTPALPAENDSHNARGAEQRPSHEEGLCGALGARTRI